MLNKKYPVTCIAYYNYISVATTWLCFVVYKGFWSVFMLLGVTAVILGVFIIICAAPFSSPCLYKAGGGLLLIAGELSTTRVPFGFYASGLKKKILWVFSVYVRNGFNPLSVPHCYLPFV